MTDDENVHVRISLPPGATFGEAEKTLDAGLGLLNAFADVIDPTGKLERASGYIVRKCDGDCGATTEGHETLPPDWTSSADGRLDYCPACTKGL